LEKLLQNWIKKGRYFRVESSWDAVKKQPGKRRRYIGKEVPLTGGHFPKPNYLIYLLNCKILM
jgi:hypothetical protein